MPTIKWITAQGTLTPVPLPERLILNPSITLDWASIITISWAAGPTRFVSVLTTGNIVFQPGLIITADGIAPGTVVVGYNSETRQLELNQNTIAIEKFSVEALVRGSIFGPTSFTIISGNLPRGLRLSNNSIVGSPTEVRTIVESRFVVRMSNSIDTVDRTFKITVEGPDSPTWVTNGGLIPTGVNNRLFVLDNDRVDVNLTAIDTDIPAGDTVTYYIPNNGGELPPGLRLSETGRIFGFTDPIFALQYNTGSGFYDGAFYDVLPFDVGSRPKNGYDTFTFDDRIYDFSDTPITPKRINRYYQFTVAATDGINEVRRDFSIYVVTEDFLRADNDILQLGTGLFTADISSTIKPIWITESNLGRRRANNYVTLFLDVYDPPSLGGTIDYKLLAVNQRTTGKVFGRTAKDSISIFVDLTIQADGTFVRPEIGQKICLASNNTFAAAYPIRGFQNIDANRYRLDIGGENAIATAAIQFGQITSVRILNGGTGYLTIPTVTFSGSTGSGATATAVVRNGRIIAVNMIEKGEGYTTPPTIIFGTVPSTIFNNTEIVIGTASNLPPGLLLDTINGEVSGNVPYQPRITNGYEFTIRATTTSQDLTDSAFADKTFNIDIIGELESGIEWLTDSMLTPINPNTVSMLSVSAISKLYGGFVNYSLLTTNPNGTPSVLPSGIELLSTGDIVGKVRQYDQDGIDGLTMFNSLPDIPFVDGGTALSTVLANEMSIDGGDAVGMFDQIINGSSSDAVYYLAGITVSPTTFDGGSTTFDKTFTFTVRASDVFNFAQLDKTFTITVTDDDPIVYSNLYVKAFQKKRLRNIWYEFITNSAIFEPERIYRYNDQNFGVQSELKMLLYAGIESVEAVSFVQAMSRNHYRKKLRFGNVKKSVAKDPTTQEIIYEVVYVEMVDNLEKDGVSISRAVDLPNIISSPVLISYDNIKIDSDIPLVSDRDHQRIFPNSIKNMRKRIQSLGERDRTYLPLWMRSIQPDTFVETGFVKAVPLCYAKPGESDYIIANIKAALNAENPEERFDFKLLDFEIDRYVIDAIDGYIQDKYLVFPQRGEKV